MKSRKYPDTIIVIPNASEYELARFKIACEEAIKEKKEFMIVNKNIEIIHLNKPKKSAIKFVSHLSLWEKIKLQFKKII